MPRTAVHFNGNLICAIDTETSGLKAGFHDILQIAVIPLNPDLTPNTEIIPFHTKLVPKRPWNFDDASTKVSGQTLEDAKEYGMDPWTAVDLFEQWFKRLGLPERKLIVPLGHNFQFDKGFILDWLGGQEAYNAYFHGHVRDTMQAALLINDASDWQSEAIPFPKVSLKYLCNLLGVQLLNAHDALADAMASAECYRKLLGRIKLL